jgi:hypothetical protein
VRLITSSNLFGREIGRSAGVGAFEDAVGIYRRLSEHVGKIDTIRHKPALGGGGTQWMDHRQPVTRRQLIDQLSMGISGGIRHDDHSDIRLASPLGHCSFNFFGVAQRLQTGDSILRRRLSATTEDELSPLPDLLAAGMTDYVAIITRFAAEGIIGEMDD